MLQTALQIFQMVIGILLTVVILLQHKGAGLGAGFGGGGGGPIVTTRRGVDLFLHKVTIACSIVFFANAAVMLFI